MFEKNLSETQTSIKNIWKLYYFYVNSETNSFNSFLLLK